MQFVRHGPDIPERLLQLHEDGRVVFFCSAGISCPAGLPGFKELVEALHALVGVTWLPLRYRASRAAENAPSFRARLRNAPKTF